MATEEEVNVLADINASDVDGHIWEQVRPLRSTKRFLLILY